MEVRLKEMRSRAGLSQNQLAKKIDMTLGTVQDIEYGKQKSITYSTLEKLCMALSCQVGDLLVLAREGNMDDKAKE